MKSLFSLFASLFFVILIISCETPKDSVTPEPETPNGSNQAAVTPVGLPEGDVVAATIGAGGGNLESADQRIQISIPAGALTGNQQISVQPISNNCPGGAGQGFRLMPHGITFAKPATITFRYTDNDIKGSAPEALSVAYQNEKRNWLSLPVKSLDTTAGTIAVNTTHFSDWGLFQSMSITPQNVFLSPGGDVQLDVTHVPVQDNSDGDFLVYLPELIPAKYIEKWTLHGEGVLTPKSNKAQYNAPSQIPNVNPAAITVFLNKTVKIDGREYKDIRLVANVYVAPEGISLQIDGGAWVTYPGGAHIDGVQNVIEGNLGTEYTSVIWKGSPTGTFHWTKGVDVAFNLAKAKLTYKHLYGKGPTVSGGSLMVDNSDETWVVGSFTLQPAGWLNVGTIPLTMGTAAVKGIFRTKRVK